MPAWGGGDNLYRYLVFPFLLECAYSPFFLLPISKENTLYIASSLNVSPIQNLVHTNS